jgi:hypothetical protein
MPSASICVQRQQMYRCSGGEDADKFNERQELLEPCYDLSGDFSDRRRGHSTSLHGPGCGQWVAKLGIRMWGLCHLQCRIRGGALESQKEAGGGSSQRCPTYLNGLFYPFCFDRSKEAGQSQ